ncbi:sporulation protein [Limimaricola pyoseonensis]|uniref:Sporulation-control protein n=1 Tax=Limimaricola pyoseonensis TaxID=521013 RepID=A0A1G7KPK5_9RHOB|nr:sporulation protein [Limimaricola pyoseonensis]SDF39137.1 sporulation-control protein [Limimaricola pyoseonensis]
MFGKVLTSLGIGGATVDAVLEDDRVEVGGTLKAEIRVKGGTTAQEIRSARLELVTHCLVEGPGGAKAHGDIVLVSGEVAIGQVAPGEELAIPVEMDVPASAPISIGSTRTHLRTRLDVPGAIDPKDSDLVEIVPNPTMTAVLDGIAQAGFRLVETEVEYDPRRRAPFVQEFDFRPSGFGDLGIEEVEISFAPAPGGVEVLLTVDNRGGLFFGGGERAARIRIAHAEASRIDMASELRRAIDRLR